MVKEFNYKSVMQVPRVVKVSVNMGLGKAKDDLAASFSLGLALADAGKFEKAETSFAQALALAPSDFNVLSNLGVMAWRTGNNDRAREVLEAAQSL